MTGVLFNVQVIAPNYDKVPDFLKWLGTKYPDIKQIVDPSGAIILMFNS